MADVKTTVEWMKTIEASTRLDIDTPIINLKEGCELSGNWDWFLLVNPVVADVTLADDPVYIKVMIWGVAHYIEANPEAEWD
jgi:hypothetical protein